MVPKVAHVTERLNNKELEVLDTDCFMWDSLQVIDCSLWASDHYPLPPHSYTLMIQSRHKKLLSSHSIKTSERLDSDMSVLLSPIEWHDKKGRANIMCPCSSGFLLSVIESVNTRQIRNTTFLWLDWIGWQELLIFWLNHMTVQQWGAASAVFSIVNTMQCAICFTYIGTW